jgi:hypothetical protein
MYDLYEPNTDQDKYAYVCFTASTKLNQNQFIRRCQVHDHGDGVDSTEVCSCKERMTNLIQTANLITHAIVFAWHVCAAHSRTEPALGNYLFEILNTG